MKQNGKGESRKRRVKKWDRREVRVKNREKKVEDRGKTLRI
jgi:hypothetical protein